MLLLLTIPVMLAIMPAPAMAKDTSVALTKDQVNTVCGKKLETNGDSSGCTVVCGLNKNNLCRFDCKGDTCSGYVALTKNPTNGGHLVGIQLADRMQVAQLCGLHRIPTANDPFGCSGPCDLQICDYNCTSADLCMVVSYRPVKLVAPEAHNLAGTFSSPNSPAGAPVPVLQ